MNVTTASVDIHGILTFHVTTTSTDVLDVAVHLDIAACSGKILNVTIDFDADNVTLRVLASDGVPIYGLTICIPATVNLLDGLTLNVLSPRLMLTEPPLITVRFPVVIVLVPAPWMMVSPPV